MLNSVNYLVIMHRSVFVIMCFLRLNTMNCVFFTFRDSLLEYNNRNTLFNSRFMILIIWSILFPVRNRFVSSANNIGNNDVETLAISFTYNKNNNGSIIEPCGTRRVFSRFSPLETISTSLWASIYHHLPVLRWHSTCNSGIFRFNIFK